MIINKYENARKQYEDSDVYKNKQRRSVQNTSIIRNNNKNIPPVNEPIGTFFNPATGADEYIGYPYDKHGRKTKAGSYDAEGNMAKLDAGEEFEDRFGNTYVPYIKNGKLYGYNIADGRSKYETSDKKSHIGRELENNVEQIRKQVFGEDAGGSTVRSRIKG